MLKREISLLRKKQLDMKFKNIVNVDNIETLSKLDFYWLFRKTLKLEKHIYLHNVIHEWYSNQQENEATLLKLKKILRRAKLVLQPHEENEILTLEERVFALNRHIKDLGVNVELDKGETVGVKYTNAKLFVEKPNKTLNKIFIGDLLVSNKRLIMKNLSDKVFDMIKIDWWKTEKYGFTFYFKRKKYVIRIHDQITLNNAMQNIIFKKNTALFQRRI